jgi:hypothetical protein
MSHGQVAHPPSNRAIIKATSRHAGFGLVNGRMINSRNCPGTCAVERKEMCLMVHVKETSRRWLYSGKPRVPHLRRDPSNWRGGQVMKIEYLHASKCGNGATVATEFKQQMAAKGVAVDVHHIREVISRRWLARVKKS